MACGRPPPILEATFEDVAAALAGAYGDLRDPHWGFAATRRDANLHGETVARLGALGAAEEETDLNTDVARMVWVEDAGIGAGAALSLVGPFAVLFDTARFLPPGVAHPLAARMWPVLAAARLRHVPERLLRAPRPEAWRFEDWGIDDRRDLCEVLFSAARFGPP